MLLFILYGLIACLLVFIKYHLDLKFIPNKRKWYEKIRFILPIFLFPIFFSIYYFWDHYPEYLIKNDTKAEVSNSQQEKIINWPLSTSTIYSISQYTEEEPKTKFQEIGEKYGTYGDTYGSLNTLFTGLAFAGLIISIFIQLLELRQTRKELANQSQALLDQKNEFAAQTKILEKQTSISVNQQKIINDQFKESLKTNFLNIFFKLVDQRNLLMNALNMPSENGDIAGHSVFAEYAKKFRQVRLGFDPEIHDKDYFERTWNDFTEQKHGFRDYQLRSYFKIYRIIFHTIFSSNAISDSEKKYYLDMIKSMMGLEEKMTLMWVGIVEEPTNRLCNKYRLLQGTYNKNMEKAATIFFEPSAFDPINEWKLAFEEYNKNKENDE